MLLFFFKGIFITSAKSVPIKAKNVWQNSADKPTQLGELPVAKDLIADETSIYFPIACVCLCRLEM